MSEWKRCECGSVEIVWPATEVETPRAMHRLKKYGECEAKPQAPDLRDTEIATLRARVKESEDSERLALRNNEGLRARVADLEVVYDAAVWLLERADFWEHCGTIPGEYDTLNDAVAALKEDK